MGREAVRSHLFEVYRYAVLCTKHPGFEEEKEWRLIYSPDLKLSDRIRIDIESVGGVPQLVGKVPLKDVPEEGLVGVEVPKLFERIIIGPTEFPFEIQAAFVGILTARNIPELVPRVIVSDIPLRT
jgi:hypothetical protein